MARLDRAPAPARAPVAAAVTVTVAVAGFPALEPDRHKTQYSRPHTAALRPQRSLPARSSSAEPYAPCLNGASPEDEFKDLVDRAERLGAAQRRDHALDLPPVAKAHDVAVVAALLLTRCGLQARALAEAFDQVRGIGRRKAAIDVGGIHTAHIG